MKKILYAVGAAVILTGAAAWPCQAQITLSDDYIIAGDDASAVNFKVTGTTGALFTGTFGSGSIPATGAGTRMMWYPKKAAFRVGRASGTEWDDANIGDNSFAVGYLCGANGDSSVALGQGYAFGDYSFAAAGGYADANYCIALGFGAFAGGEYSIAVGPYLPYTAGWRSMALGSLLEANGEYSTAMGLGNFTTGYASFVIGCYNVADFSEDHDDWVSTDSLFIVGNGSGGGSPSNALAIRKNANMRTGGVIEAKEGLRSKPLGDLSMGTFTAGNNPEDLDAGLKYPGE